MIRWHSLLTHAWRAKLSSLVVAPLRWLFIRHSIIYSPLLRPPVLPPLPAPVSATPMPPP